MNGMLNQCTIKEINMNYVLAHACLHEDHDDKCGEVAYLYEETEGTSDRVVKIFTSKKAAEAYMTDNRWGPEEVMVVPEQEMT